jgi:hypothetical protein
MPISESVVSMVKGLLEAWRLYNVPKSIILILIHEGIETNIGDQRLVELEFLRQKPDVRVERANLVDLIKYGKMNEEKELF